LLNGVATAEVVSVLPPMILVAEEARILGVPCNRWITVVTVLAGLDAGDQDFGGPLTARSSHMTGFAGDSPVSLVAKGGIGKPTRGHGGRFDARQPAGCRILHLMAQLAGDSPQ